MQGIHSEAKQLFGDVMRSLAKRQLTILEKSKDFLRYFLQEIKDAYSPFMHLPNDPLTTRNGTLYRHMPGRNPGSEKFWRMAK